MIVRAATEADTDKILEMGQKFFDNTHYAQFAAYSFDSVTHLINVMRNDGVLLVAESNGDLVGMVGLVVCPFMFDHETTAAYEVMWWVDPDERHTGAGTALLRAIEPACKAKGVQAIQMVRLENSPEVAGKLYERMGYRPSEFSYTKMVA